MTRINQVSVRGNNSRHQQKKDAHINKRIIETFGVFSGIRHRFSSNKSVKEDTHDRI